MYQGSGCNRWLQFKRSDIVFSHHIFLTIVHVKAKQSVCRIVQKCFWKIFVFLSPLFSQVLFWLSLSILDRWCLKGNLKGDLEKSWGNRSEGDYFSKTLQKLFCLDGWCSLEQYLKPQFEKRLCNVNRFLRQHPQMHESWKFCCNVYFKSLNM